jgi:simple sugar transport system permease protein
MTEAHRTPSPRQVLDAALRLALTTLAPVAMTLALASLLLTALGVDAISYFAYVVERGLLTRLGLEQSLTRMAPLLLLAASLIVAFRAGVWNLGVDGQSLLAAVAAAAIVPALAGLWPRALSLLAGLGVAAAVGALWALLPALLRAYQGVNEIITTLMMTFLGSSLANALIKLVLLDPATTVPQTRTLPVDDRLPRLFGTTVGSGLLIGLALLVVTHLVLTRTAFGLRLQVLGINPRAARHAGLSGARLILAALLLSGALAGLAGAVDVLGVHGNVRADWNPAYGLLVVPLVFLARLNGLAAILFVFLFAVLSIGGESAARRLGVPHYVNLVIVAVLLVASALGERLDRSRTRRVGG